jgi:hypothetical protein
MNNQNIFLFIVIASSFFVLGVFFVGYEIYPYEQLYSLYSQTTNSHDTKINNLINLNENEIIELIELDSNNISSTKTHLINYLWPNSNTPFTIFPSKVETNISDVKYSDLSNLKQINEITITMDHNLNSIAYLFLPTQSNNELMIYHQGHSGDFFNGKSIIQKFLNDGYPVLALSMPLLGMNNQPIIENENFGKIQLSSHNHFQLIDNPTFSSMKYFVEPVIVSLNHISQNYNFQIFRMIGISGGGWTTTVVSAIDDRIKHSYSVSGSIPIFLRTSPSDLGDYEQINSDFYNIANYLELYILSSYGDDRRYIQIFNYYDPCCFSGDNYKIYVDIIRDKLKEIGSGYFFAYLDDTHLEHKISDFAIELIIEDINSNPLA